MSIAIKKLGLIGQIAGRGKVIRPGPLFSEAEPFMAPTYERALHVIRGYFQIFADHASRNWSLGSQPGGYLLTNNAVVSLLSVLKSLFEHVGRTKKVDTLDMTAQELVDAITPYAKIIARHFDNASHQEILNFRSLLGAHGQHRAALAMQALIRAEEPEFTAKGLEEYLRAQESNATEQARHIVPEIQLLISQHVIGKLKENFGDAETGWWVQGVPQTVRADIVQLIEADDQRPSKEQAFTLVHYKKVISANWVLFESTMADAAAGNSKSARIAWLDKLNRIRNKISHPERGPATEDELNLLVATKERLTQQIRAE